MNTPSSNGLNGTRVGRDACGRFTRGNQGGPGNPHAARVGAWRKALADAIEPGDVKAAVRALIDNAKAGEPWAVRELLDRCLGKSAPSELLERLERLELALAELRGLER